MTSLFCGIDFHKNTCTICILDKDGRQLEQTTKRTTSIISYLSKYKDMTVGIEASGGVNDFVDRLKASGHKVKIIDAKKFRLIGLDGKKTDKRDSQAIAKCLKLDFLPGVHHKSKRSREIKSLLVSRELVVSQRVGTFNHIRGILREYGITIPQGKNNFLKEASSKINELENGFIRSTLFDLLKIGRDLMDREEAIESRLKEFTKEDETIERLKTIPGVGELSALALIAITDDIQRFKKSKEFASYIGLVPREYSSGDKKVMGRVTKSGPEILRRYLIHGARSVLTKGNPLKRDSNREWAVRLSQRAGVNKATVALAHRISRIAFNVMKNEVPYGERADAAKNLSQEDSMNIAA